MIKNNEFTDGFIYLWKGFCDLKLKGIKAFVILPLLANIFIFIFLFYYGFHYAWGSIDNWLSFSLPSWLSWAQFVISGIKIFLLLISVAILLFILSFISTLCANLIAAPFNGLLSAKLSHILQQSSSAKSNFLEDIIKEIKKAIYFLSRFLFFGILILILYFIPYLNLSLPFIIYLFSGWMMAIEYIDYPADNFQVSFKTLLKILKQNKSLTLGYGLSVAVFSTIPFINFFIMPAAVLAATRLWHEKLADLK